MKKTLLILSIVIAVMLAGFILLRMYTKSFSPSSVASYHEKGIDIDVNYSQPGKKGRYVFGREQDKALVPYGKVWRTGANEATVIKIGEGISFAGKPVKPGSYSLWTIPGQSAWTVILNSETGQWGTNYNDGQNFLKSNVSIRINPKVEELFKIYFQDQPNGTNMILSWDQTEAIIPIQRQ
ncbi:DUF2911 domain-containing protein [Dyadobacter sp. LHD-138]|uniref:DUF2911 domain-containing protein n=1 Tax=Dyadobacter sp. LHD-138 TaxID=3071413 RepID=UPI0027E05F9B|nr:DUF2911 domain-containing protein [Dyadobacter sp. LHD-138]MDQ6478758.1 DUF2911 domain-containing protein [Dyadobacter sp. LHD-138]